MELYAEAFETVDALDKLEAFASFFGPDYYGLPRNKGRITLKKESWTVPEAVEYTHAALVPLRAGERMQWRFVG